MKFGGISAPRTDIANALVTNGTAERQSSASLRSRSRGPPTPR